MGARINPDDIQFRKDADYYMDPIGLAVILMEEYVDYGIERDRMIFEGLPTEHIWYFDGILRRTETILDRLGVENIPVVGND
jgi:hypothetical protein